MMPAYLLVPAVLASLLPLLAAVLVSRDMSKRRKSPNQRAVDIFLNRLVHETWYNDAHFVTFRVDCFLFDFRKHNPDGLEKQVQYDLFDYMRTLDMSQQQAIVKIYIWLRQHGVRFDFRFQWNRDLPFRYNWQQRKKPAFLKKMLDSADQGQLMAYDLSKDPHALRRP